MANRFQTKTPRACFNWAAPWQTGLALALFSGLGAPAAAQLLPDNSLGAESSVVIETLESDVSPELRIEGGAGRGFRLFHSFQDFNVAAGQQVYFANPSGIEQIFSRVTGNSASRIDGLLGVDGAADLFLLNPQGLIFGPGAQLDISGSFLGTTATDFDFGEGQQFGISDLDQVPLLTSQIQPGLQFGSQGLSSQDVGSQGGNISNRGNLTVGQDLQLNSQRLDLQGQLQAGGNVTLRGRDQVEINDSPANPFIAAAGEQLLVQGDSSLSISALSHPHSQLSAGQDLILRSGNTISGDAQFRSGSSFRIQQLDQSPGAFQSPKDPVIRAGGDVSFTDYQGTSLHILAGGQVTADNITILGAAIGAVAEDFLQETVALSNGASLDIDGSARPTLDIRAGLAPAAISTGLGVTGDGSGFTPAPADSGNATSADISLNRVEINAANGQVFLSNQYQPNLALADGTITVGTVLGDDDGGNRFTGQGADFIIDARQDFRVTDQVNVSSGTGSSGNIQLNVQGDTQLNQSYLTTNNFGAFIPGNIDINTGSLTATNGAQISINSRGLGDAGKVEINAIGDVIFDGLVPLAAQSDPSRNTKLDRAGIDNRILSSGQADSPPVSSGGINMNANNIVVSNGAQLQVRVDNNGNGQSGDIRLRATDLIAVTGVSSEATSPSGANSSGLITSVEEMAIGRGGNIVLEANRVEILDGGSLQSNTIGDGDSGNILITARESVQVSGADRNRPAFVQSKVNESGVGQGGNLTIQSANIEILDQGLLETSTEGQGNAGDVSITATESLRVGDDSAILSQVKETGIGDGGDVMIFAPQLEVFNDSEIAADSLPGKISGGFDPGSGNAGGVVIDAPEFVILRDGVRIGSSVDDNGSFAGDISIRTGRLEMSEGARLAAGTDSRDRGSPGGGTIRIDATESVTLSDGSQLRTIQGDDSFGKAGDVEITAPEITLDQDSEIISFSEGKGNGGTITLRAEGGSIRLTDGSKITANLADEGTGNAGSITLIAQEIIASDKSEISSRSEGKGNGGNITLQAPGGSILLEKDSDIIANVEKKGTGSAGNIFLTADDITLQGPKSPKIESRNRSRTQGQGGNITIRGDRFRIINGGGVITSVENGGKGDSGNTLIEVRELDANSFSFQTNTLGEGSAGNLTIIATESVRLQRGTLLARVNGTGVGQAGDVVLETGRLEMFNGGRLIAGTEGDGAGGNVRIRVTGEAVIGGTAPVGACSKLCESGFFNTVEASTKADPLNRGGSIDAEFGQLTLSDGGRIDVSSRRLGQAGDIRLTVGSLDINTAGQISSSALATGQGGTVEIVARDGISITDTDSGIFARTSDSGDAGRIDISSPSLSIINGGQVGTTAETNSSGNAGGITLQPGTGNTTLDIELQDGTITAATQSTGDGGDLVLSAPEAINIRGQGILTAQTSATGSSGNVRVTSDRLTIDQGTTLSTTATATANPPANEDGTKANIELNADEMNLFGTVQVLSETQGDAQAGQLTLRPNNGPDLSINLTEGSQVSASTSGLGDGGQLSLIAPRALTISGEGSLSAETRGPGMAGAVEVQAQQFTLENGAELSTSTSGSGDGGNININVSDSVTIRNQAQLLAESTGSATGTAGEISITTGGLELSNAAGITSRSNNSGDGGNITLNASRPLLLRDRSVIETDAGGSGNGGNIAITTPFLIGLGGANADIIANAVSGDGGRIDIDTQRLFNFGIQDGENRGSLRSNQSNDISASSETGTSGTVALDTIDVDPSRGLAELPTDLTDPGDRISQGCRASSGINSFVASGRGGIPQGPDAPLRSAMAGSDWITADDAVTNQAGLVAEPISTEVLEGESVQRIVEVQGWQRDSAGRLQLVLEPELVRSGKTTASAKQMVLNCKAEPTHSPATSPSS